MTAEPRSCDRIGALLMELACEVEHCERASADHLAVWQCQLAALQSMLATRSLRHLHEALQTARDHDQLLSVAAAAQRLACSKDWLYRHHHRLPFAVKNGRQLRFSAAALDRYIRARVACESPSLVSRTER